MLYKTKITDDVLFDIQVSLLRAMLLSGQGTHSQQLEWCSKLVALRKKQLEDWGQHNTSEEVLVF